MALISVILLIATLSPFVLGACSLMNLTLATPVPVYDSEQSRVMWEAIGYAKGYEITHYTDDNGEPGEAVGDPVFQPSNVYAVNKSGTYWIGVKAISSKSTIKDSAEGKIRIEKENTEVDVTVDPEDPSPDEPGKEDPSTDPDDVLPSNAPSLNLPVGAKRRFNYISVASVGGISVPLTENTGKVVRLESGNNVISNYWSYDSANGAIDIEYSLFGGVATGEDTQFTAYTEDGDSFSFYVTLCALNDLPADISLPSYGAFVYCKTGQSAAEGLKIEYDSAVSLLAVSVDGIKIPYTTTNFSSSSKYINFNQSYLKNLEYGTHRVELFTTKGILDFYVFVYSSSIMCYNLSFEFDDTYPAVMLKWQVDYAVDKYEVVIDGTAYSSTDYPDRFEGNSFDMEGLVNGGSCTAYVRSYVNSISTPAVSATVAYADNTAGLDKYFNPESGFTYLGTTYNRYIDSDEEMEILAHYMILYNYLLEEKSFNTSDGQTTMTYMDVYIDSASLGATDARSVMKLFETACGTYKESLKYSYAAVALSDGAFRIGLQLTSQNEALYDSTTSYTESASNVDHLKKSSRKSDFDDFKINQRQGVSVKTSDQLFFAIEAGYKPLPEEGSVAEKLYELAKDVCRTWIDDSMTDYEKVHAIYDWLGVNVIYDYNIVNEMSGILPSDDRYDKFYSYDSFYLEGVLENGVAVCNGIAKTFVVLCGIEGITAVKVNGTASGGAHAWNKVYINEKWYIVDSTWSNQKATDKKEVFSHDYLFLTTSESASKRTELTESTLGYYCGDTHIRAEY